MGLAKEPDLHAPSWGKSKEAVARNALDLHVGFYDKILVYLGVAVLLPYNGLLGALPYLAQKAFHPHNWAFTSVQVYMTCSLVTSVACTMVGSRRLTPMLLMTGFVAMAACLALIAGASVLWFQQTTGYYVGLVCCLVMGVATSTCQSVVYTLCGPIHYRFSAAYNLGQGLSGVGCFGVAVMLRVLLPKEQQDSAISIGVYFSVGVLCLLGCVTISKHVKTLALAGSATPREDAESGGSSTTSQPVDDHMSVSLETTTAAMTSDRTPLTDNSTTSRSSVYGSPTASPGDEFHLRRRQSRTPLKAIRRGAKHLIVMVLVLFVTFLVFPGLVSLWKPVGLNVDQGWYTLMIIGMFQVGDVVGRTLPAYDIHVSTSGILWWSVLRALLIPFFCISQRLPTTLFFGWTTFRAFLMFTLGLSNGSFLSDACIYAPDSVENADDKKKVAQSITFFILTGITMGSWMSSLTQLGVQGA